MKYHIPEGTQVEGDIVYAHVGERELLLDLYLPVNAPRPLPVVVWVHGGGWSSGSKGNVDWALSLLSRGFAVVDVDYRLSGEAIFPAQIQDCKAAVRWIRANAETYGLSPERIGAWGSSAGGHLVALMGTAGGKDTSSFVGEFETEDHGEYSSRVLAVCDWFGPTDFLRMNDFPGHIDHDATHSPESQLIGGPIQENEETVTKANPITHIKGRETAFLIVHGEKDQLVPYNQSELLYAALERAGALVVLHGVKDGDHGFGGSTEDNMEELLDMTGDFFEKYLKPVTPALADVSYGPHERNVLDFWRAESAEPTPVVVSIHGGGFGGGDKSELFEPHGLRYIVESLSNGVSFASINYRLAPDTPLTDIFLDVARAVQFLRHKADEWNIDRERIAACGGSAGGGASLWLAFHDDVADLTSEDPVLRESSRVTAAVAFATQSTYDLEQWEEILGSAPTAIFDVDGDLEWYHLAREEVHSPKGRAVRKELDILGMIGPKDPPVYLCNPHPDIDLEDGGDMDHHPRHAITLKKRCDGAGVEAVLVLEDTPLGPENSFGFILRHFGME